MAPSWPRWRRFVLNFGTVYFALYFLGQALLPLPASVTFWLADTLSRGLFHQSIPNTGVTGSGDTAKDWTLALLGLLSSLILGVIWTVIQRRGPSVRQLSALSVGLRAALICWLYSYGLAKFNFGQFGLLAPGQLSHTYGESSPMFLLWTFMASSPGYQLVAGFAEVLPALLLLHRRTVTPGALIAAVTMTNVFALNMLYDVPVKLFSFHLLLAATVLAAFDHARLLALVTGGAVPAQEWLPRPKWIGWAGWAVTVLGLSYVGLTAVHGLETLRRDQVDTRVSPTPLKTRGFHWVNEYPYNR
ncbi:hypothetical protein [Deinococcus sp.]|uniref:hypothetical protein n=1 Tax=Deinococcus sp. TaxID=47478 RepID=UPI00286E8C20|nr:hypothetical protein [Deinococcus sp.]